MAAGMLIMQGVAMGASLLSTYMESKSQQAIAKYNAAVARQRAEAKAKALDRQSDIELEDRRSEISEVTNTLSNRGLDITQGSPLLILSDTFGDAMADVNEIRRQASIARITGEAEAAMFDFERESIKRALPLQLLSGGMGGGAQFASLLKK